MSRWLDLAMVESNSSDLSPDNLTKGDRSPAEARDPAFCRVLSGCRVGNAERSDALDATATPITEPGTYGFACGLPDRPKTWSGKVVSLAEWRQLSDWERDGSTGLIWNALTNQWEAAQ